MTIRNPKILHVIKRLDVAGGAERIVAELLRHEPDHDVLVFNGRDSFFNLGGRDVIRASSIPHALWLCLRLYGRYDIFHLHLFPAIYFALLIGKKSIIHEHNTHNRRREFAVFRLIEWLVYRRARSVFAISEAAKNSLRGWIGPRPKIHVLPNFVAPLPAAAGRKEVATRPLCKQVLMVASFTPQKRQDLLIRAISLIDEDVHLSFAGVGPTLESCKILARSLGQCHRVTFCGAVADVGALYSNADLCVLVSHWEGFGLVVVEAAQHGVPTVVSDVDGLREICPDGDLLFKGQRSDDLALHIQQVLSGRKCKISAEELRQFAARYSLWEYSSKLKSLYFYWTP